MRCTGHRGSGGEIRTHNLPINWRWLFAYVGIHNVVAALNPHADRVRHGLAAKCFSAGKVVADGGRRAFDIKRYSDLLACRQ